MYVCVRLGGFSSGDCDVLITLPSARGEAREFAELHQLLRRLADEGFLRAHLSYR